MTSLIKVTSSADILQQLANEDEASQFLEMVVSTGLNETLAASGPFTIFVPVNTAFAKLPGHLVANVTSDKGPSIYYVINILVFLNPTHPPFNPTLLIKQTNLMS